MISSWEVVFNCTIFIYSRFGWRKENDALKKRWLFNRKKPHKIVEWMVICNGFIFSGSWLIEKNRSFSFTGRGMIVNF